MPTTAVGALAELREVFSAEAPILTACLDVSRDNEDGETEVALRWRALREELAAQGAPEDLLDSVGARLVEATGMPGGWGRTVVANADGILLDRLTPGRPQGYATWAALPRVLPVALADAMFVPHLAVRVDRTEAEITVSGRAGEWSETVEGGDGGPVHKTNAGGWAHLRWQHRVEETWERHARDFADRIDRLTARIRPEVIVLEGDPREVGEVQRALPERSSGLVRVLDGGPVEAVLAAHAAQRSRDVADRFAEEAGNQRRAAFGRADVVAALRRAQVDTLLLPPAWSAPDGAWFGTDPLLLGLTADDVRALGDPDPRQGPLDDVLLRALVGSDATLAVVEEHMLGLGGEPAALLRFADDATPHRPLPGSRRG